jgi:hypothetical protein
MNNMQWLNLLLCPHMSVSRCNHSTRRLEVLPVAGSGRISCFPPKEMRLLSDHRQPRELSLREPMQSGSACAPPPPG